MLGASDVGGGREGEADIDTQGFSFTTLKSVRRDVGRVGV